jgi:hypothetical protein
MGVREWHGLGQQNGFQALFGGLLRMKTLGFEQDDALGPLPGYGKVAARMA